MDGLRAYAFTDLLKGTPAEERIACAEAQDEAADIAEALAWAYPVRKKWPDMHL